MKPDPLPPSRALSADELLMLRVSGGYPVKVRGSSQHALCKRLVKLGLGVFEGGVFTANERGVAVVQSV